MTKVFISYSRKDKIFAEKLHNALKELNLDSWIDWIDIPPTADWWDQIQKGIESADAFLVLLSPDSIASKVCRQEIDHAIMNGKRLIPLVVRDIKPEDVHEALTKLNWIFFRELDDFKTSLGKLETGIKTDLPWVESHRRLQVKAIEWDGRRDRSLLLRGKDLQAAEEQLANAGLKDPQPTDLQRQYVLESRRRESQTRNTLLSVGSAILVMLAFLSVFAFNQRNLANDNAQTAVANQHAAETAQADAIKKQALADSNAATAVANEEEAKRQAKIARARELAAQAVYYRDRNLPTSLLLGIEAYRVTNGLFTSVQAQGALLDNTQFDPHLDQFLFGHSGSVTSLAFSPDSKILASSSSDTNIILWDIEAGQPTGQPLNAQIGAISSVAFSPDGTILASGGDNGIILWDVDTRQAIGQPLTENASPVNSVAFSPDGTILAWGNDEGIIFWDVQKHQLIGQPLLTFATNSLIFSPDGKALASRSVSEIFLWNVKNHQPIGNPMYFFEDTYYDLAFGPDGRILASNGPQGVNLWNARTHGLIKSHLKSSGTLVAYSPDGKILASDEIEGITFWDVETPDRTERVGEPLTGYLGTLSSLIFSPDGKMLASGSSDGTIVLWEMGDVQPLRIPASEYPPRAFDVPITLWDVESRESIGQLLNGQSGVLSVALSPDGKTLASYNLDGTIFLWDVESRQTIGSPMTGHLERVNTMAFSSDGKTLASGSDDETIILWDVETGKPIGQLMGGHEEPVLDVLFTPDGKFLVSSSYRSIILWDVKSGQPIGQPMRGRLPGVESLALSPDGNTLASSICRELLENFGCIQDEIILWDVQTRQLLGPPLIGSLAYVHSLAFSPDGKMLVSGGPDSTIVLWDVETRQPIGQPVVERSFRSVIKNMAFSPDGTELASGDGSIILWDLDPESWIEISCQRAGRNLTRAEWAQLFPDEKYRKTCEQWTLEPESTAPQ